MLGELTQSQRVRRGELAQEVLELGLLAQVAQELTANHTDTLTQLELADREGRDEVTLRLTVLGEVMNSVTSLITEMYSDGQLAAQELMDDKP